MRKNVLVTTALIAFGLTGSLGYTAVAQTNGTNQPATQSNGNQLSSFDRRFMTQAAQGSMAEVELSRLALRRGASNEVKQYAQQMINDHTQANARLMQLANRKGVSVPKTLDAQHRQIRTQLQRLSGRNFDQQYMMVMENDHVQTVSLFQSATQQAQDRDVKAFASSTLPKLEGHLQMAQAMMGNNSAHNSHNQR
ncbi:MAG TPA: DUF4142 domain-containing protein [Waterburya sp.]|jgi:putative membrane protein